MPLIKGIRNLVITEPQRRRNNLFFFFLLVALFLFSCTREKILIGASWDGDSDLMVISEQKMKMNYASYIPGNSVFIGSFYEVLQKGSNNLIDRLEVIEIEFQTRTDGTAYCRVWGNAEKSSELSYLLADQCKPIYQR